MRLIDADALTLLAYKSGDYGHPAVVDLEDIADVPTIDAEPVKHGRWNVCTRDVDMRTITVECSECGVCFEVSMFAFGLCYNYCPNCGAKMDLEGRQ